MADKVYPKLRSRRFRRGAKFVAVRPIKLGGDVISPGDDLPVLRTYHLMSLYRRMRIGEKGDPWTEGAIIAWNKKAGLEPPEPQPEIVASAGGLTVYSVGKGWLSVRDENGNEIDKLRGQSALDDWVKAHSPTEPDPEEASEGESG